MTDINISTNIMYNNIYICTLMCVMLSNYTGYITQGVQAQWPNCGSSSAVESTCRRDQSSEEQPHRASEPCENEPSGI